MKTNRLLSTALAFGAAYLSLTPAYSAHHGPASGVTVFPTVTAGSGWTGPTLPDQATTASIGANVGTFGTGNGWGDDAIAIWDNVPYVNMTQPGLVCVLAFQVSGIKSVLIGVDGGTFVLASYTTNGPAKPAGMLTSQPGNPTLNPAGEYCVQLNPSTPDGQHEFRAIVTPYIGIPRVLQSSYTAIVTANNAAVNVGPHGNYLYSNSSANEWPKQVVITNPVAGFSAGAGYYIVPGGMTPGSFGLSTTALPTTISNAAVTCNSGSAPTIAIGTPYNGGQPLGFTYYNGPATWGICKWTTTATVTPLNQVYYICGAAGVAQTSPYSLSDSYSDATASCGDLKAAYTGVGVTASFFAYALVLPQASGTMNLDIWHKGDVENMPHQNESLFEYTNWNSNVYLTTIYVDASGSDSTSCGTTSGSPCATIGQASANLGYNSNYQTYAQIEDTGTRVGGQNGCLIFTRANNPFKNVGQQIVLAGSNWGWNFTATGGGGAYGLPKAGYYPTPSGQTFYVSVDAFSSGSHFAVATTPLAAQTPGDCVRWSTANDTTIGAANVSPDVGGDTVDLMCDSPCSTPTQYTFGNASGNGLSIQSNETWLNILPYPGLSPNNVQIDGASSSNSAGANTYKVHLEASVLAPTVDLITYSHVNPGATSTVQITTNPTLTADGGSWYLSNSKGCLAEGAASGSSPTGYAFTPASVGISGSSPPYTLTLSGTNYSQVISNGCPAGTPISIIHPFTITPFSSAGEIYGQIWLDGGPTGANVVGAGTDMTTMTVGKQNQIIGQYYTKLNISNYQTALFDATFTEGVHETNIGQGAFMAAGDIIASSTDNVGTTGLPQTMTFQSCTNCSSTTAAVLHVSALPSSIKAGYVIDNSAGAGACHGNGTWVTGYTAGASPTITVATASLGSGPWGGTGCPSGTTFTIASGQHIDWDDYDGNGNDLVLVNSSMNAPATSGLGYFMQGGPYFDMAMVNTALNQASPALGTIEFESYLQNVLISNSRLNGPSNLRNDISYYGGDVYFVNDTYLGTYIPSVGSGYTSSRGATYFYNDNCPSDAVGITGLGYPGFNVNNSYFPALPAGNC